MDEQKCTHEWKPNGLWDGKTPEGIPTGGIRYICTKCGESATTKQEIETKGGTILEGFDALGRPVSK